MNEPSLPTNVFRIMPPKKDDQGMWGHCFGHDGEEEYQMMEVLGTGSSGVVRRCKKLNTNEMCAVKVINLQTLRLQADAANRREQLVREIKLLRKLKHDYIVNMVDYVETPETLYLIMEIVEVRSLPHTMCRRAGRRGWPE